MHVCDGMMMLTTMTEADIDDGDDDADDEEEGHGSGPPGHNGQHSPCFGNAPGLTSRRPPGRAHVYAAGVKDATTWCLSTVSTNPVGTACRRRITPENS